MVITVIFENFTTVFSLWSKINDTPQVSNRGRFRERCSLVAPSRKEVEEQRPSQRLLERKIYLLITDRMREHIKLLKYCQQWWLKQVCWRQELVLANSNAWQTFPSLFTDLNHHQHTILTSLKNFDGGEKSPALVMALILVKINPLLYFHIFEIFGQCIM